MAPDAPADSTLPSDNLPDPARVSDLVAALTDAAKGLEVARRALGDDYVQQVARLHRDAAEHQKGLVSSAGDLKSTVQQVLDEARSDLGVKAKRAEELSGMLAQKLSAVDVARARLQADVDNLSAIGARLGAERDTWQAQVRAAEARYDAVTQELRGAVMADKARISRLEEELRGLMASREGTEARLVALEKKKMFGIF